MARLIAVALSCLITSASAVLPKIEIGCNQYAGVPTSTGVTQWLSIRYAAPPVGALRFSPPADPLCYPGILPANSVCIPKAYGCFSSRPLNMKQHGQYCLATGASPTLNTTSEDCLFLEVYAPTNATAQSKLPVFFYIQGGGFNKNSLPNADGRGLITASNNTIVVVTINYRVGPYGFLTDGATIKANNGLRDQRKALEWVQEHISKFGGNPKHVVLGGASAGAASISLHLTAYGGQDFGLFHAAAAESVSFATVLTAKESRYQYDNLAIRLGCVGSDSLSCLRSKTAQELQAVNYNVPYPGASEPPTYMYNPAIDDDVLSDYTYGSFEKGNFIKVPVIIGDDTNGGTYFAPEDTSTLVQSNTWLRNCFPRLTLEQLGRVDELYPNPNQTCPNTGCYWRQLSNAYGEMRYMCPGLFISNAFTKYGVPQSWAYRYNVEDPEQIAQGDGVPHTVETYAIWGPENVQSAAPASYYSNGTNAAVVPVIQGYWTSFVKSFDPNKFRYPGSVEWTAWTSTGQQRVLFQTGGQTEMETVDEDLLARCRYWAEIGVDILQ